jgi:hypothetical protein
MLKMSVCSFYVSFTHLSRMDPLGTPCKLWLLCLRKILLLVARLDKSLTLKSKTYTSKHFVSQTVGTTLGPLEQLLGKNS